MDTQNQGHYEEVTPASDLWNWEEQPELEGELVQTNERSKQDGTSYMAYVIERDGEHEDSNQVTILGSKILDARLKKCELGTRVKITYLGKETSAAGYEYRNFRVDKWVNEGATALAPKPPRDSRTPDRVAAERGEIARPMEPIINLPEDEGGINVADIPF
jgi:hypothetical protein